MNKKELYIELLKHLLPASRNLLTHLDHNTPGQAEKNKLIAQDVFDIIQFAHNIPSLLLGEEPEITERDRRFLRRHCEVFLGSEISKGAYGEEPCRLIKQLQDLALSSKEQ